MAAQATAGTWTQLDDDAPDDVGLMLLLSDGNVMAANPHISNEWYLLRPDREGHYVHGHWERLAPMRDTRLFFSAVVLRDGRVFVAGGEYGTGPATAEIYDPVANQWTPVPVQSSLLDPTQSQSFKDSVASILPDGSVLVAPVNPGTNGTLIYDPLSNSWSAGPSPGGSQNEVSWVKLPDGSILTVDRDSRASERFIPHAAVIEGGIVGPDTWKSDAPAPVDLFIGLEGYGGETGPALLLPDGRVFFLGGAGDCAIYTPSGTYGNGNWTRASSIPDGLAAPDAPAAMLVNGKILCAAGDVPVTRDGEVEFPEPTNFYEYDYRTDSFARVIGPTGWTDDVAPYQTSMLALPDGTVLYSNQSDDLYVYQPDGPPLPAGKPVISSVTMNGDGSWHVTGTGFNGISEGAAYGDDAQMSSNYPLARLTAANGIVFYGRTYNWSSTGVATGPTPVSTEFAVPGWLFGGAHSLQIVANGISSDPVPITLPVWVDFNDPGRGSVGTFDSPFISMDQAINGVSDAGTVVPGVAPGGTILIKSPGSTPEKLPISRPMTIRAVGGPVTIGRNP